MVSIRFLIKFDEIECSWIVNKVMNIIKWMVNNKFEKIKVYMTKNLASLLYHKRVSMGRCRGSGTGL